MAFKLSFPFGSEANSYEPRLGTVVYYEPFLGSIISYLEVNDRQNCEGIRKRCCDLKVVCTPLDNFPRSTDSRRVQKVMTWNLEFISVL